MTVKRGIDDVFGFFENIKNMEIGGAVKSVAKGEEGWWTFEHVIAGKSKIRSRQQRIWNSRPCLCRWRNRVECLC